MTMKLDDGSVMRPWHAAIDAQLVARLVRPLQPGLIGMGLARRIVGGVEALAGRLGLLARFSRVVRGLGTKDAPAIVHALWPKAPSDASARDTLDSADARAATPRAATGLVVSARVVELDHPTEPLVERRLGERVAAAGKMASALRIDAVAGSDAAARGVASVSGPAAPPASDPSVGRARPGTPRATPSVETTLIARLAEVTTRAAVTTTLAGGSAGTTASARMPEIAAGSDAAISGGATASGSPTPPAGSPPVRRARLGAPLVTPVQASESAVQMPGGSRRAHGLTGDTSPTPERSRTHETLDAPVLQQRHSIGRHAVNPGALAVPDHTERVIEPAVPVVPPRRSSGVRTSGALPLAAVVPPRRSSGVRTSGALPLAPVAVSPASAPAVASPPASPAGSSFAAPAGPPPQRSILVGPPPGTPPPPRLDLREIATQVQRILAREAVHERARRGLRR